MSSSHHFFSCQAAENMKENGAPDRIRTCDLCLRRAESRDDWLRRALEVVARKHLTFSIASVWIYPGVVAKL